MNPLFRLAAKLTGTLFCQRALGRLSLVFDHLIGVGTGAGAMSSGESIALDTMIRMPASPYTIFDVGANRGQYLRLVLDRLTGMDLSIHCFEPGSTAFQHLAEYARAIPIVQVNRVALGREEGTARLYYDRTGSTRSSLSRRQLSGAESGFD